MQILNNWMEAQEERLKTLQKPQSVISVQKTLLDCQVRRCTARAVSYPSSPREQLKLLQFLRVLLQPPGPTSLYKIEKCPCVLQNWKMLFYFIFDEQKKVFSWLLWFLRDLNVILKEKMLGVPLQSSGWHLLLSLLWPGLTPW